MQAGAAPPQTPLDQAVRAVLSWLILSLASPTPHTIEGGYASPPVTIGRGPEATTSCSRRDECVTAYMPDPQWDLLQQSLRAHNANGSEADVATSVIVEAGVLVRIARVTVA